MLSLLRAPELPDTEAHTSTHLEPATGERAPASLGGAVTSATKLILPKKLKANWTLQISCGVNQYQVPRAARVRLQGSNCHHSMVKSTEVINKTNGIDATVFAEKDVRFSTDFMLLQPGENNIEVTHTLEDGQVTHRNLVVVRTE